MDRGGTVAINAIHLDRIPEFDYDDLWWERSLRSVANVTRRDAASSSPSPPRSRSSPTRRSTPCEDANLALERLSAGRIAGAAVLRVAG